MVNLNELKLKAFISVAEDSPFPIQNIPFGVFKRKNEKEPHIGTIIGDMVLDLTILDQLGFFDKSSFGKAGVFQEKTLNAFMALGRISTKEAREAIVDLLRSDNPALRDNEEARSKVFIHKDNVEMLLPVKVGGYTDFYSSIEHASNIGRMFRGDNNPLLPNWKHLPVGYDGRASSVIVSDTDIRRPLGQIKNSELEPPVFSESMKLDAEIEVAFLIGKSSELGVPISIEEAPDHIFGMVLLNDWSARDIQKWEYVPLGPFLGKNFATSISPWVITMDALEPFRVKGRVQDQEVLPYLQSDRTWSFDITLEMLLKTEKMPKPERISAMNFKNMYWDCCQQLAHHTINGCNMNAGDLIGSGTVSGKETDAYGSLIELSWNGEKPIKLSSGEERSFLHDGDSLIMTGYCQGQGYRIGFGDVKGKILPSLKESFTAKNVANNSTEILQEKKQATSLKGSRK